MLRTRHILIDSGGQLHAGSALCPFQGNFTIILYGRWVKSSLDLSGGGLSKERRGQDSQASVQDRVSSVCCQAVGTRRADSGDGRAGEARRGLAAVAGALLYLQTSLPAFQPPPNHSSAQGGSVSLFSQYDGQDKENFPAGRASGPAPLSSHREF